MVNCVSKPYARLRGRICTVFGTQAKFAEAMGLSIPVICRLLSGGREWKRMEIAKTARLLNIPVEDIPLYFFTD